MIWMIIDLVDQWSGWSLIYCQRLLLAASSGLGTRVTTAPAGKSFKQTRSILIFHVKSAFHSNPILQKICIIVENQTSGPGLVSGPKYCGEQTTQVDQKYIIIIIIVVIVIIIFIIVIIVRSKPLQTACHHQIHADILLHFPDIMFHATLLSKKHFRLPATWSIFACSLTTCIVRLFHYSNYLVGGRLENEDNLVESWTESMHWRQVWLERIGTKPLEGREHVQGLFLPVQGGHNFENLIMAINCRQ